MTEARGVYLIRLGMDPFFMKNIFMFMVLIFLIVIILFNFIKSLFLDFLSRTFTIHMTAGEVGAYLFNSSLPHPPSSQTLKH